MSCSAKSVTIFLLFLGISLNCFAQGGAQSRIPQAIDKGQITPIRGTAQTLAKPESSIGRVDGNFRINGISLVFGLSSAQQIDLQTLLREQQDRSSQNYHKWLTPAQYADRFGMSGTDLAKVTSWLQSEGFEIESVSRSRTKIAFSGTVSQVEAAFRTEMHHYLVDGELHFANATDLSVPAAFAGTVLGIGNLSDFRAKPRGVASSDQPSAHYTDSSSPPIHYLAPADFATIYDLGPLYTAGFDGTGQTIAIVGQTAIYTTAPDPADIDNFRTAAGLPATTSTNFQQTLVPLSGTAVVDPAALPEADLDLEWAEAVAPNVNLNYVYVGNASNFNAFDALKYAIDNNLAPVISITYGTCEPILGKTEALTLQQEAQQANAQGQTIIAASGDAGAADCDGQKTSATQGLAVDVPASIPEFTGVGGTEFSGDMNPTPSYWNATNAAGGESAISYIPEIVWDDSIFVGRLNASGGGASTFFAKPAWQVGTNVPADQARDVPDVALSASSAHDPYLICSSPIPSTPACVTGFVDGSGNLVHSGGTSFGAPSFAGIVAIINQRTNSRQGNVNPTLYSLAESAPTAFHDINTGSNIVPCTTGTPDCPTTGIQGFGFLAGTGYDQATGLGSIDANVLVNAWPLDYSISVNPVPISIATPGSQGTATILLNPIVSFNGSVALTCTPQSGVAGLTCQITPSTVTPSSPNATLTVLTVGSSSAAAVTPAPHTAWLVASLTFLSGIFLIETPFFRRRRIGLRSLLLLAFLGAGLGCGGSSSPSTTKPPTPPPTPTPAGIYTVKITATSGGTSFSTTVNVGVL